MLEVIGRELKELEGRIKDSLETRVKAVSEVTYHLIESGGKRIRPALSLLSYKLCSSHGDTEKVMDLGVAIEYIHSATLFHDDVVDEAEMRRGRRSANSIWGNELTVLVGDFLFARSFLLLVRSGSMELLELLSKTTTELAEGEIQELVRTGDIKLTEGEYLDIIKNKTAVLMAAACKGGAVLAGADDFKKEALYNFGLNFGMSFQIMDDYLDYAGETRELGKEVGKDLEEGKITLPLIHLLSNTQDTEKKRIIDAFFQGKDYFDFIKDKMLEYGSLDYTFEKAKEYAKLARLSLESFPDSPYKKALLELLDINLKRRA